jgi:hypothetical protein
MDDECSDWDDMLYLIRFLLDESLLLELVWQYLLQQSQLDRYCP